MVAHVKQSFSKALVTQNNKVRLWAFPIVLGLLFGLLTLHHSVRQGQLSVPITYDDIGYFNDALERLQSIFDHGWLAAISGYIRNPPHSPYSTVVALIAFALVGIEDWGPAAINVLLVVAVLVTVRYRLKGVAPWVFAPIAIAILCWPLMGFLVIESRPDIFCALVSAYALVSIVGRPWLASSSGHKLGISCLVGFAILAKPSISPLTILLYFAAITLASVGELMQGGRPIELGKAIASNLRSIAVVVAISVTYFAVGWRHVYSYITEVELSSDNELWRLKLDVKTAALYYLTGEGGQSTMGPWLVCTLVTLVAALLVGRATKYQFDRSRIVRVAAITLLIYLCVTIPAHKSSFIGVIVTCTFLVIFVEAIAFIVERLLGAGNIRLLAGLLAVLTMFSIWAFHWHWYWRSNGGIEVEPAAVSAKRKELLSDVAREIATRSKGNLKVLLTQKTLYFNNDTLLFEFLRRRYRDISVRESEEQMSLVEPLLKTAQFVVTFSADNTEVLRWLPSAALLQAQNDAIQHSDLKLIKIFPSPSGVGTIMLYQRYADERETTSPAEGLTRQSAIKLGENLPFGTQTPDGFMLVSGWGESEAWGRWTIAPTAELAVRLPPSKEPLLATMNAQAFLPRADSSQRVVISVGETHVADWTFGPSNPSGDNTFPIPLATIGRDGVAIVRFELPDARRPADFGSPDTRLLGLGVRSLRIAVQPSLQLSELKQEVKPDPFSYDGQILSFARDGNGNKYLVSGWSQAEGWGVWSDGPIATVQLADAAVTGKGSAELVIEARGFVTQSQPTQRVRVRVNGADAGELLLGWDITSKTLQVPAEALKSSPLKIELVPENPMSPATTGASSDDKRLLGVGLKSLQLSELKQDAHH